jgi:hypothetical protein
MATDGCLFTGTRAINFKSADRQLVETFLDILGRTNRVYSQRTRSGGVVYFAQFKDTRLYSWLQSVGLTPRKSLTLGALDVPGEFLAPLVRGLLDGDGNISNSTWRADTSRRSDYYYETLRVRFVSASRPHLDWLQQRLREQLGLRGWICMEFRRGHGIGCLAYGKHDSIKLLKWIYADQTDPCLLRKRAIWDDYVNRHENWVREPLLTKLRR